MIEGLIFSKIGFSWKGKNGLHANLGLLWTLVLVAYFVGFSIFFWVGETGRNKPTWMESGLNDVNEQTKQQFIVAIGIEDTIKQVNYNTASYIQFSAFSTVEKPNLSLVDQRSQQEDQTLLDCEQIVIEDAQLIDFNKLKGFACIDIRGGINSNEDSVLRKITIRLEPCGVASCESATNISTMLQNGLLTVYSSRYTVDEGTTKMRMEKRSFEFNPSKIKHAQLNLRKQSRVDRSTTYSSGNGVVDSWMNVSNVSEYFEYGSNAYGSVDIDIDIFQQDIIARESKSTTEFISLLGAQLFLLALLLDFIANQIVNRAISKEISNTLLPSKHLESQLLLKLINKAKLLIAQRKKTIQNAAVMMNRDNYKNQPSKKEIISMNTDNFFQFDVGVNSPGIDNVSYSNNIQFIPNYSNFELQKILQSNKQFMQQFQQQQGYPFATSFHPRSTRQSVANNPNPNNSNTINASGSHNNNQSLGLASKNASTSQLLLQQQGSYQNGSYPSMNITKDFIQLPKENVYQFMNSPHKAPSLAHIPEAAQIMSPQLPPRISSILNPRDIVLGGNLEKNSPINNINPNSITSKDSLTPHDSRRNSPQSSERTPFQFTQLSAQKSNVIPPRSMTQIIKLPSRQGIERYETDHVQEKEQRCNSPVYQTSPKHPSKIRKRGQSLFAADQKKSNRLKNPHLFLTKENTVPNIILTSPMSNNSLEYQQEQQYFNDFKQGYQNSHDKVKQQQQQQKQFLNFMKQQQKNGNSNNNDIPNIEINNNNNENIIKTNTVLEQVVEVIEKEPEHEQSTGAHHNFKRRMSLSQLDFTYFEFLDQNGNSSATTTQSSNSQHQLDESVLTELSFGKILDMLFEFNRFKTILLDQNQLELFEYITQSPIGKYEYFQEFCKKTQHIPSRTSLPNPDSSSPDSASHSSEEKIVKGWKAMKKIESKPMKSEIDIRLINSINNNIYCLVNSSNLEDALALQQQQQPEQLSPLEQTGLPPPISRGGGGLAVQNNTIDILGEQQSNNFVRTRGKADALNNNLSESSCNRLPGDECLNF